jgi:hypothetical protein
VSEKRNEIIEEQRKAREEFLKLKKMQQNEIAPEPKPSEIEKKPETFSEKVANFWYHFKAQTIIAVFLVVVIAILTAQCATREKYDMTVLYFAYSVANDAQIQKMEEYFEQYAQDVDGNGEVNVCVMNCSFNPQNKDPNYRNVSFVKVQSIIAAETGVVLFVMDEEGEKYFNNAWKNSLFTEDLKPLPKDFYTATKIEKLTFPEGLRMGLRKIEGTAFEGKEEAISAFENSEKVYEKIKKQNS